MNILISEEYEPASDIYCSTEDDEPLKYIM